MKSIFKLVLFIGVLPGCGTTFKNSQPLGLNNIPRELLSGSALKEPGPYRHEPNLLVGRLVYLHEDEAGKCPRTVTSSDQLEIGTKKVLAANEEVKTKEPTADPLVDGKLVIKSGETAKFGTVTQSVAGEGVYTIRVVETKYAFAPTLPSDALETEAAKPLPKGFCKRYWVEWTQVLHGGTKLYTKLDAKAAGSTAAFQIEGDMYVESTNVQNRFIVNLGLRDIFVTDVERNTTTIPFAPLSVPKEGFKELDDTAF